MALVITSVDHRSAVQSNQNKLDEPAIVHRSSTRESDREPKRIRTATYTSITTTDSIIPRFDQPEPRRVYDPAQSPLFGVCYMHGSLIHERDECSFADTNQTLQ